MNDLGWDDIMEEDYNLHSEDMAWNYSTDPEEQGCRELPPVLKSFSDYLRMRLREDGFAKRIFPPVRVFPTELQEEPV